ncbi:Meiotically up-regulated protein [Lachnellula hyalina]|uniref:Meiotically up-regulated protein n=2 Tax=Lachnellula TaxID=47830 RepID=A0A8H8R110_9HELO|nr:Meiotically up-regulated protein [Lachnellula hyalina]TVY25790.1 Meiotically up-regulated protein [Lachnellula hyalina]TVY41722.1 Meiotically up-regulated protein [Lachnellula subtilissima]
MLPGGVCPVLDYELSQMTDYVAEMAQRLCNPNSPVSPAFRKFVSGVLSSTRLPHTTILLGMNYLARRMNTLSAAGPFKASDGQVWRMLTIGLLLGSKFLDDNTFQNRSWSEVSGISVPELNVLEHEWLISLDWKLYVNLDESTDFKAWLQSWNSWRETKNLERAATLDRLAPLAPIDTNVQRPRPYQQSYSGYTKTASREHPQSGYTPYEHSGWMNSYPTPQLTPPSAPDSGVNTPEYLSATGGGPRYNDWALFNQYSRGYQTPVHAPYVPTRIAPYHTPYSNHYGHHYNSNIWDSAAADCNCGSCNPHAKQSYFMGHGYGGPQIVAG